jgi:uncharacterized protein YggU (UPF0235/DUF167 family)
MKLFVITKTNAKENRVKQIDESHFTVLVKEAPIEGRANAAIIKALATFLNTAPSRITLRSGETAKRKVFDYE